MVSGNSPETMQEASRKSFPLSIGILNRTHSHAENAPFLKRRSAGSYRTRKTKTTKRITASTATRFRSARNSAFFEYNDVKKRVVLEYLTALKVKIYIHRCGFPAAFVAPEHRYFRGCFARVSYCRGEGNHLVAGAVRQLRGLSSVHDNQPG